MHRSASSLLLAGLMPLAFAACAAEPAPAASSGADAPVASEAIASGRPAPQASPVPQAEGAWPRMTVHKTPTCGCCTVWVEHVREAGFEVDVVDVDDLGPVKQRLGVPYAKGSCHTAEVGGYLVEGHVPASDIARLLAEAPAARGLVLPGMPLGSPGMEMPDGRRDAFTVELVDADGSAQPFQHHPGNR